MSITDKLEELNPDALVADGLEEAMIGITDNRPIRAVYDSSKCVGIFMQRDGMTYEEAREFFDFNTAGAYVGEEGPIFVELE